MSGRLSAALDKTGAPFRIGEPLARHTTIGVGGRVPCLLSPRDPAEAARALQVLIEHGLAYRVLGAGSNVIAADGDLDFAVIETAGLAAPPCFDGTRVEAGAGVFLPRLAREAASRGLAGLEFAIGIPGSVGGALRMNAGAWGSEMSRVVDAVTAVAAGGPEEGPFTPRFAYRTAGVGAETLVTRVAFRLAPGEPEALLATLDEIVEERRRTQPVAARSAGCAFRNPMDDKAGRLIQACGLRGLRRGAAEVSPLHANFVLNRGGASAADVLGLIAEVKARVLELTGVALEQEVEVWRRLDGGA